MLSVLLYIMLFQVGMYNKVNNIIIIRGILKIKTFIELLSISHALDIIYVITVVAPLLVVTGI